MSEPVTNAEVEDVLSSIRRLVSEDKRPKAASKPAPENDRLVLTPALRVASPVPESQPQEAETTQHIGDVLADDLRDDAATAAADFATPSAARQRYDDSSYSEPAADTAEDVADDYTSDPYDFADDEAAAEDDTAFDGDTEDTDHTADIVESDGHLEAAEAEADYPAEDEIDADANPDDTLDIAEIDMDDADSGDIAAAPVQAATPPKLEMLRPSGTLSDKIAALETAIGKISDRWEPDSPSADDYAGTEAPAMAWEDDVQRDATGARMMDDGRSDMDATPKDEPAAKTTTQAGDDSDNVGLNTEDQFLDEEALRDLVSEIVRSELQGALGERITRNVRKLVRRELHRAMTAQELE